ncbi:hypothetical protein HZC07_00625 [Candidatus Micrarchaeota archaeon]|nr:hypothetical protein [Candidatus Micrarchaeota archaeon]
MKLLCFHTLNFKSKIYDGVSSGKKGRSENRLRKKLGTSLPVITQIDYEVANALVGFICIEKEDGKIVLSRVRDFVIETKKTAGAAKIVIVPFGHLSTEPAEAEFAKTVIDALVQMIRELEAETTDVPFGWDKSLFLDIPCHHYNVRFGSF